MMSSLHKPTQRLDWERYRTSGETCVFHSWLIRFSRSKEAKGARNKSPPYDPNVISIAMQFAEIAPTNSET